MPSREVIELMVRTQAAQIEVERLESALERFGHITDSVVDGANEGIQRMTLNLAGLREQIGDTLAQIKENPGAEETEELVGKLRNLVSVYGQATSQVRQYNEALGDHDRDRAQAFAENEKRTRKTAQDQKEELARQRALLTARQGYKKAAYDTSATTTLNPDGDFDPQAAIAKLQTYTKARHQLVGQMYKEGKISATDRAAMNRNIDEESAQAELRLFRDIESTKTRISEKERIKREKAEREHQQEMAKQQALLGRRAGIKKSAYDTSATKTLGPEGGFDTREAITRLEEYAKAQHRVVGQLYKAGKISATDRAAMNRNIDEEAAQAQIKLFRDVEATKDRIAEKARREQEKEERKHQQEMAKQRALLGRRESYKRTAYDTAAATALSPDAGFDTKEAITRLEEYAKAQRRVVGQLFKEGKINSADRAAMNRNVNEQAAAAQIKLFRDVESAKGKIAEKARIDQERKEREHQQEMAKQRALLSQKASIHSGSYNVAERTLLDPGTGWDSRDAVSRLKEHAQARKMVADQLYKEEKISHADSVRMKQTIDEEAYLEELQLLRKAKSARTRANDERRQETMAEARRHMALSNTINKQDETAIRLITVKARALAKLTDEEQRIVKILRTKERENKKLEASEKRLLTAVSRYQSVNKGMSEAFLRMGKAVGVAWHWLSKYRNILLLTSFGTRPLIRGIDASITAFVEHERAVAGATSVALRFGEGTLRVRGAMESLSNDGILKVTDASKGLRNLLSTGIGMRQAVATMDALKNAAAYNRQGMLGYGESIVGATDGIKNMISRMVDNAGITKNLSNILEEQAAAIGKNVHALTEREKHLLITQGIIKESAKFEGDAARLANETSGSIERMGVALNKMSREFGAILKDTGVIDAATGTGTGFFNAVAQVLRELRDKEDEHVRDRVLSATGNDPELSSLYELVQIREESARVATEARSAVSLAASTPNTKEEMRRQAMILASTAPLGRGAGGLDYRTREAIGAFSMKQTQMQALSSDPEESLRLYRRTLVLKSEMADAFSAINSKEQIGEIAAKYSDEFEALYDIAKRELTAWVKSNPMAGQKEFLHKLHALEELFLSSDVLALKQIMRAAGTRGILDMTGPNPEEVGKAIKARLPAILSMTQANTARTLADNRRSAGGSGVGALTSGELGQLTASSTSAITSLSKAQTAVIVDEFKGLMPVLKALGPTGLTAPAAGAVPGDLLNIPTVMANLADDQHIIAELLAKQAAQKREQAQMQAEWKTSVPDITWPNRTDWLVKNPHPEDPGPEMPSRARLRTLAGFDTEPLADGEIDKKRTALKMNEKRLAITRLEQAAAADIAQKEAERLALVKEVNKTLTREIALIRGAAADGVAMATYSGRGVIQGDLSIGAIRDHQAEAMKQRLISASLRGDRVDSQAVVQVDTQMAKEYSRRELIAANNRDADKDAVRGARIYKEAMELAEREIHKERMRLYGVLISSYSAEIQRDLGVIKGKLGEWLAARNTANTSAEMRGTHTENILNYGKPAAGIDRGADALATQSKGLTAQLSLLEDDGTAAGNAEAQAKRRALRQELLSIERARQQARTEDAQAPMRGISEYLDFAGNRANRGIYEAHSRTRLMQERNGVLGGLLGNDAYATADARGMSSSALQESVASGGGRSLLNKEGQTLWDATKTSYEEKAEDLNKQLRTEGVVAETKWIDTAINISQAWQGSFSQISTAAKALGHDMESEVRKLNAVLGGATQIAQSIQAGMKVGGPAGMLLAAPGVIGGVAGIVGGLFGKENPEEDKAARRNRSFGTTINRGPTQYTIAPTMVIEGNGEVYFSEDGMEVAAGKMVAHVQESFDYGEMARQ